MPYKDIERKREYHRNYMRESRKWYREHQRCADCGRQDGFTLNGRYRCFECNKRHNATKGNKNAELDWAVQEEKLPQKRHIIRNERVLHGLCYNCGQPIEDYELAWGGEPHLCLKCYEQACELAKKGRAAHFEKCGKTWGQMQFLQHEAYKKSRAR